MRRLTHTTTRFFARLQQRFIRARSGSVLILVVALLVILALIGTAWMASARNDRYGSTQNIANTQIDLLVEGAVALVQSAIVDDLFSDIGGTEVYRSSVGDYRHFDYPDNITLASGDTTGGDMWLADRVPVEFAPNDIVWRRISYALVTDAGGNVQFDDPRVAGAFPALPLNDKGVLRPSAVEHPIGSGKFYPAFGGNLAADADGDGIADALLWKLPIAPIDGVTYYMAYRVIDNNSAVNANIAWSANQGPVVGIPGNFFPTNVDLYGMLRDNGSGSTPADQIQDLSAYRFNDSWGGPAFVNYGNPVSDTGLPARTDFTFQSPYDAFWMQFGRRLANPGLNANGDEFQGFSTSDSMALAYHFIMMNPDASSSLLETYLAGSLYEDAAPNFGTINKAYTPGDVAAWFNNFDYDSEVIADRTTYKQLRPLLNASNPVANMVQEKPLATGMGSFGSVPVKVALNAADFEDLYRAYYSVMVEPWTTTISTTVGGTPYGATEDATGAAITTNPYTSPAMPTDVYQGSRIPGVVTDNHPYRMFRPATRDPRAPTFGVYMRPEQMMLIRAALAAVNTIDLRDSNNDVAVRTIPVRADIDGALNSDVLVDVYGTENQCYISEVFAQTDALASGGVTPAPALNPFGYIAIELYNPHSSDAIDVQGWKLAVVERLGSGGTYPNLTVTEIIGELDDLMINNPVKEIPADGRLILENYQNEDAVTLDPNAAQYRPGSQNLPAEELVDLNETVYVPNLHLAFNKELVILRPKVKLTKNEPIEDMVPIDQYDFTGLALPDGVSVTQAQVWHYVRANGSGNEWKCVYPGRYDANRSNVVSPILPLPRHEGTEVSPPWTPDGTILDEWDPTRVGGMAATPPNPAVNLNGADSSAGYTKTFNIQLTNASWAGPNPGAPAFPFGNFARNGDILQVPFIGGYRIYTDVDASGDFNLGDALIELNSVTIDASFAEDTDHSNDAAENLGRFCPIDPRDLTTAKAIGDATAESDDYNDNGEYGYLVDATKPDVWRYRWTKDIFDYLTVQAPHEDHFPLADETDYSAGPVDSVDSDGNGTDNDDPEKLIPIQGLININTAPWKVLAALPMVLTATGEVDVANNILLAKEIVRYRDVDDGSGSGLPHGPFTSIFDLNCVLDSNDTGNPPESRQGFRDGMNTFDPAAIDADDNDGDLSPLGTGAFDGVTNDFETRFLMINRISNLITTRSDSFTAYIVVQGWRNAETTDAELVVQRRVGAIIDRSGVVSTTTKGNLSTTRFPQN